MVSILGVGLNLKYYTNMGLRRNSCFVKALGICNNSGMSDCH
jgi:hypothetical protein